MRGSLSRYSLSQGASPSTSGQAMLPQTMLPPGSVDVPARHLQCPGGLLTQQLRAGSVSGRGRTWAQKRKEHLLLPPADPCPHALKHVRAARSSLGEKCNWGLEPAVSEGSEGGRTAAFREAAVREETDLCGPHRKKGL